MKTVTLVYKSRPNDDGKTTHIEFVGLASKWLDCEIFMATCEITHFTPFFIHIEKKEWRKIKNDTQAILKKYTDTMDDLFNKAKNNQL